MILPRQLAVYCLLIIPAITSISAAQAEERSQPVPPKKNNTLTRLKQRFGEQQFFPKAGFVIRLGQRLPELVWEHPKLVASVVTNPSIPTRWFNEQFEEVKTADKPGRYYAYGEAPVPSGPVLRRAMTCCCVGKDVNLTAVARKWLKVTRPVAKSKRKNDPIKAVLQRWHTTEQGAVELAAFLESGQRKGPSRVGQWQMENATRQVRLKRKLMGLDKEPIVKATVRPLTGRPAPTLRNDSLKRAGISQARVRKLEAQLDAWYAASQEPMAVVVARKGVIILAKGYGKTDDKQVTIDMPMLLHSAMKPLIGLQLAMYVDRGILKLDEPIGNHLPNFKTKRDRNLTFRAGHVHATGIHFPWNLRSGGCFTSTPGTRA